MLLLLLRLLLLPAPNSASRLAIRLRSLTATLAAAAAGAKDVTKEVLADAPREPSFVLVWFVGAVAAREYEEVACAAAVGEGAGEAAVAFSDMDCGGGVTCR